MSPNSIENKQFYSKIILSLQQPKWKKHLVINIFDFN